MAVLKCRRHKRRACSTCTPPSRTRGITVRQSGYGWYDSYGYPVGMPMGFDSYGCLNGSTADSGVTGVDTTSSDWSPGTSIGGDWGSSSDSGTSNWGGGDYGSSSSSSDYSSPTSSSDSSSSDFGSGSSTSYGGGDYGGGSSSSGDW